MVEPRLSGRVVVVAASVTGASAGEVDEVAASVVAGVRPPRDVGVDGVGVGCGLVACWRGPEQATAAMAMRATKAVPAAG